MRETSTLTRPLCIAQHFVERLHERFPGVRITEGQLQRELAHADWYPAEGGDHVFYALRRLAGHVVALVVAFERGAAHLVTVYEPRPGWEQRLAAMRPWPLSVVLACSP
jgi:hypothetical protein